MAYFEWLDDLVIDQGPIDKDHHRLVDLVNLLHAAALQNSDPIAVRELMAELIFDTQDHLLREEELMLAVNFPDLAEHKQSHLAVMARLQELQREYHDASSGSALRLAELLRDWLAHHIREADKELRDHLRNSAGTQAVGFVAADDVIDEQALARMFPTD